VANALLRGRGNTGLLAFTYEKVNDPIVKELMNKISIVQDPEIRGLDARVEVETNTGKAYSGYSNILNEIPELDVKKEKIKAKFIDLSGPVLGSQKTQMLTDIISKMEEVKDVSVLTALL
jgi:2-methylcitrate dehydratase PrpD